MDSKHRTTVNSITESMRSNRIDHRLNSIEGRPIDMTIRIDHSMIRIDHRMVIIGHKVETKIEIRNRNRMIRIDHRLGDRIRTKIDRVSMISRGIGQNQIEGMARSKGIIIWISLKKKEGSI